MEIFDLLLRTEKLEDHSADFSHRLEELELFAHSKAKKFEQDLKFWIDRVVLFTNGTDCDILPDKARWNDDDFEAFPRQPDFDRTVEQGLRWSWWLIAAMVVASFTIGLLTAVIFCLLCMKKQAATTIRQLGEELGGAMEVRRHEIIV